MPINGGAKRDRTADLLRARQALSQLSYGPVPDAEFEGGQGDRGRSIHQYASTRTTQPSFKFGGSE